ncbi:hypothetical protein RRG08_016415 [Elysia crispata]|uniref:Uncharacterized protein n=1 Tax=Elysia crispata TaxID=231223 RepID=A0AAE0Y937_9GAST|nr:hypothetical protein RRG08_016415 [Elysia crispata]
MSGDPTSKTCSVVVTSSAVLQRLAGSRWAVLQRLAGSRRAGEWRSKLQHSVRILTQDISAVSPTVY